MLFLVSVGCTAVSQPTPEPTVMPEAADPIDEPSVEPTEPSEEAVAAETAVSPEEPTAEPEPQPSGSADADVVFVSASMTGENVWSFSVTVEHPDTGWEDYADGWDVVLPDGTVLLPKPDDPFTRLLLHPHETEQPFTRSQSGIEIPTDVTEVTVRAHDIVDGFGGEEVVVDLTAVSGEKFEVSR